MWLSHPRFRNVKGKTWEQNISGSACEKIKGYLGTFKFLVRKQNKEVFGNLFERKKKKSSLGPE